MEHIGSCEERVRWEAERERLVGRIKELQAEKEEVQQAVSGAGLVTFLTLTPVTPSRVNTLSSLVTGRCPSLALVHVCAG